MKNYIQTGDFLDFTASGTIAAGALVPFGSLFGVAVTDMTSGSTGVLAMKGVFRLAKSTAAGSAITAGGPVYRIAASGLVTGASSGNTLCGYATAAAGDSAATANVKLLG